MAARPDIFEINLQYMAKADLYKIAVYKKLRATMDMSWLLGFQAMLLAVSGVPGKTTKEVLDEHIKAYARSCTKDGLPSPRTMIDAYRIGMKSAHRCLSKSMPDTILDDIQVLHRKLGVVAQELETYFTGNTRRIYDRAKTKSGIIIDP